MSDVPPPPPSPLPAGVPAESPLRGVLHHRSTLAAILLTVCYGVILRWGLGLNFWARVPGTGYIMTAVFVIGGPAVIGFLLVNEAPVQRRRSWMFCFFGPWLPTVITCVVAMLVRLEGMICLIFALPIFLLASSLGGLVAGVLSRRRELSRRTTLCVAMLPFLLAPLEAMLRSPVDHRAVESTIVIHAPAATVWNNIKRVRAIQPGELRTTWAQRIGFPRPVEATLSYEGVGGVRDASFERGLRFFETVTDWEPEHRLAFGIRADTAHIPPGTLDDHVSIGGRYFDVLDGEYRLEPLPDGSILLHLTSHQRVSTDFNRYAGLWTDAVMQNLQSSILQVIQHRCEQP